MSRSIKKANEYIFGLLAEFVQSKNVNISISTDDERRIQLNTQDEQKWLEKLKIKDEDEEIILPTFRTAWFEFKHENQPNESQVIKYFVTIGATTQLSTQPEIIQVEELNGGMITALIFELKIPVKQSADPLHITHRCAYTPGLSTSSSSTFLQDP